MLYFYTTKKKDRWVAVESGGRYHPIDKNNTASLYEGAVVIGDFKTITPRNGGKPFHVVVVKEVILPRLIRFDDERGECILSVPRLKKGRLVEDISSVSYTNYQHFEENLKMMGIYEEIKMRAEKFAAANNRFKSLTVKVKLNHNGIAAIFEGYHYLKGNQRWEEPLPKEVFVKFFLNKNGLLDFEFNESVIRERHQADKIVMFSESIKFNSEGAGVFGDVATYESKVVGTENIVNGEFNLGNTVVRRYDVHKVLLTKVTAFNGQTIEIKTLLDSMRNVYEFDHETVLNTALNNFELLLNADIRNLNYNDSSLSKNGDAGFFIAAAAYVASHGDEEYVTMKDINKYVGINDIFNSKFTNTLNGFIARDENQLVLVRGRIERLAVKLAETNNGTIYLNWNGMIVYHLCDDTETLRWGTVSIASKDEFYSLERVDELNERCNTSFNKSDIVNSYGEFLTLCEELFDEVPRLNNTMFFAPLIEAKFPHLVDKVKKVLEIIDEAETTIPKIQRGGGGSGFWTSD